MHATGLHSMQRFLSTCWWVCVKVYALAYIHYIWTPPGPFVSIPLNACACVWESILLSVQICNGTTAPPPSFCPPLFLSSSSSLSAGPVPSLACPLIQSSPRLINRVVNIRWAGLGVGTAASCKLIITLLFSVSASNLFPCCCHGAQCMPAVLREHARTSSSSSSPFFYLCWKAEAVGKIEGGMERKLWLLGGDGGRIWRCGGIDGGAHYSDADLGRGESTCCRQWPWKEVGQQRSQHSCCFLYCGASAGESTLSAVSMSSVHFNSISGRTAVSQQLDVFPSFSCSISVELRDDETL